MSDLTYIIEDMPEDNERIPKSTKGKIKLIRKLVAHRFYWAMAFFYSLFVNIILIWEHKL